MTQVSNPNPDPISIPNRNPNPMQSTLGDGTNDNSGSSITASSNSSSRNSPETEKGRLTKLQKKNIRNFSKNSEIQFETGVPSTICLSHREDVDGLSSAALVKSAFKECYVILLDYSNLIRHLKRLSFLISSFTEASRSALSATEGSKATASRGGSDDDDDDSAGGGSGKATSIKRSRKNKRLIICDLGLNKKNESAFVEVLGEIVSNGYKVEYIDHHDVGEEIKAELRKVGVTLVHSTEECTSVQVYQRYKKKLTSYSSFYAAAGALTDYLEQRPIASMLVSRFDRHFLMLESTALSYMISSNQHDEKFLLKIVNFISKDRFPHDIEGGFMMAEKYAIRVSEAVKSLEGSITRKKNLAYVRNDLDLTASVIVNFVLGISGRPVALVYKPRDEINSFVISIRGSKECEAHLGRLVNEIASNFGGSGGGHDKASGAVIPKDHLNGFINELNRRI
ncbi:MAG: DHHA1 domain-containing protein [Nitrososphaeraceae archaeon]